MARQELAIFSAICGLVVLSFSDSGNAAKPSYPCHWIHGRLTLANGGWPNLRIWKSGTSRMLGVSCFARFCGRAVDEEPPNALKKLGIGFHTDIWGDFYVCPQARERQGLMRPVGLTRWRNVLVKGR